MRKFSAVIISLVAVIGIGAASLALSPSTATAAPVDSVKGGVRNIGGSDAGTTTLEDNVKNTINVILYITGIAAVIMIVIGGMRYVLSGGDSSATKGAKDTILYAVVGLIVAIIAFAIVNFVVGAFS